MRISSYQALTGLLEDKTILYRALVIITRYCSLVKDALTSRMEQSMPIFFHPVNPFLRFSVIISYII